MRLEGASVAEITHYLLAQGVQRTTKNIKNQRVLKPTHSTVANMFHDPVYYGILVQSSQTVDLREISNFKPMIEKEMYDAVQVIGYGRTKDTIGKKRKLFLPLRGVVYCAICNSPQYMVAGQNLNGSKQHVLSYRCDNKSCTRSPRSLRAFKLFDSLYEILESIQPNGEAYERYKRELEGMTDEMIIKIKQEVHSKQGMASHLSKEISDRTRTAGQINEKTAAHRINNSKIDELSIELANIEFDIQKLEEKIVDPERIRLAKDEFLNLLKTAPDKMRAGSAIEKDRLFRILFLNVHVDNEKVANYLWREPFATMVKLNELQVGGGGWT